MSAKHLLAVTQTKIAESFRNIALLLFVSLGGIGFTLLIQEYFPLWFTFFVWVVSHLTVIGISIYLSARLFRTKNKDLGQELDSHFNLKERIITVQDGQISQIQKKIIEEQISKTLPKNWEHLTREMYKLPKAYHYSWHLLLLVWVITAISFFFRAQYVPFTSLEALEIEKLLDEHPELSETLKEKLHAVAKSFEESRDADEILSKIGEAEKELIIEVKKTQKSTKDQSPIPSPSPTPEPSIGGVKSVVPTATPTPTLTPTATPTSEAKKGEDGESKKPSESKSAAKQQGEKGNEGETGDGQGSDGQESDGKGKSGEGEGKESSQGTGREEGAKTEKGEGDKNEGNASEKGQEKKDGAGEKGEDRKDGNEAAQELLEALKNQARQKDSKTGKKENQQGKEKKDSGQSKEAQKKEEGAEKPGEEKREGKETQEKQPQNPGLGQKSNGEKAPKVPEGTIAQNEQKKGANEGKGLGDKKGFNDLHIKEADEKYDPRYAESIGEVEPSETPGSGAQRELAAVELEKSEQEKERTVQRIPLPYKELLREN